MALHDLVKNALDVVAFFQLSLQGHCATQDLSVRPLSMLAQDIGTGSGFLAMLAAKYGAKKAFHTACTVWAHEGTVRDD